MTLSSRSVTTVTSLGFEPVCAVDPCPVSPPREEVVERDIRDEGAPEVNWLPPLEDAEV